MYKITVYERNANEYYNETTKNCLDFEVETINDLLNLIELSLKSNCSIEIYQKVVTEENENGN